MHLWKMIPFMTALLAAQAGTPSTLLTANPNLVATPQAPAATVPLYRVTVVQGSAKAINYRNLKRSTEIDLLGTVLVANASGEARVKSEGGAIQITATFKNLPPASSFGGEFLTYVLWGVSPEGRATNLGEVLLEQGHGKVKVTEKLQTFGLVVTAEPYFAVTQPSDVVVMENAIRKGSVEQFEFIDAKYELLKRGQYTLNLDALAPLAMDDTTPFAVFQARNAVRIARASGAKFYAPEAYGKAIGYLVEAETKDGSKKARIISAREAVQRAEDARLIAIQKQGVEVAAMERKTAQDKLDAANQQTAQATAAGDSARKENKMAELENRTLRATNEGLWTANKGLESKNDGLQTKNEGLRNQLMVELNAVLQTRATVRGLIVNMSGVLFENGKASLLPTAREKLAKIAGILSTHKGLKIEAEGFTDSKGSNASNQVLSEKRAQNTRDYLVQQGVASDAISFKGFGESHPIATNETAAGRQENRRVELVVSGEGLSATKAAGL
ncbi:MAG: OmpA family protein [Geothrix sp.]|uniref:OmpA family protein n=1 Tax=Geothrix sp. TaxID=1962974 RepID=UPI001859D309|nr:OmpA family protein [Geothrix sp.]NWJ41024.1 OmpA family protein [Geothrix sp.]WIL20979.1 MAG: OmpA family protein [Geothrix sp.]